MDSCARPHVEYPTRVPIKVIGKAEELVPDAIAALIIQHLGETSEGAPAWSSKAVGPYISFTFWITLPDADSELPLRVSIQTLPGFVMQL